MKAFAYCRARVLAATAVASSFCGNRFVRGKWLPSGAPLTPRVTDSRCPRRISVTLGTGFRASETFTPEPSKRDALSCLLLTNEDRKVTSLNAAVALLFQIECPWRGASEFQC